MANLPFIPQIQNGNGIIKDTMNWVKVSGSFIASGDEKFLVIGNFYSNQFTNFLLVGGSSNPRYFVDDVSVCDCDDFKPKLGKDTTLCVGQQLLLKANVPKEADSVIYTWQDGSKDSTYLVTQPGTYWVSAYIEDYKITVTDSIRVNYTECNTPQLWIPNSFTPNGDGLNDKFEYGNAENYEIKTTIYNRWGQLIFESENTDFWDGKYKGKTVTFGTYIYHIEAIRKDTMEKKIHCGRITVL
jgi:gliding motility-associated-like protein